MWSEVPAVGLEQITAEVLIRRQVTVAGVTMDAGDVMPEFTTMMGIHHVTMAQLWLWYTEAILPGPVVQKHRQARV